MAIVPLLQIVFFYMAIGGNPIGLKMGVVDDEIMSYEDCFNSSLITTFVHDDTCDLHKVSCRFLHELNDSVAIKQYYKTYEEAYDDAKKGKIIGFVHFARNFTESLDAVQTLGKSADDGSAENSRIVIRMDQSDLQLTFFMQARFYQTYKQFAENMMSDCQLPIRLGNIPVSFEEPIYGSFDADFKHSMAPPMIMVMMFYIAAGLTVAIFIADRKEGFWNRTLLAGVTLKELMLVHVLTHSVVLVIQLIETIILIAFVFGAENKGSNLAVIFLLMMLAYSGMFFGILLSVECNDLREANFVLTGIATPMVVLAGKQRSC
jgi:ABC-2 family transporter protein